MTRGVEIKRIFHPESQPLVMWSVAMNPEMTPRVSGFGPCHYGWCSRGSQYLSVAEEDIVDTGDGGSEPPETSRGTFGTIVALGSC